MSHEAVNWALRQDVPSTEKFILMLLAERSNHEGVSWPGYNNIAELTSFTKRTVKRAVSSLEERGLMERHARYAENGRQTSNVYVLRMDRGRTLIEIATEEQQRVARRAGQLALIPEEPPAGEGDRRSPSEESPTSTVDNPVHNGADLSTGVTDDHPQGDTRSPSEGDTRSPLESQTNQDPVDPPVVVDGGPVDNESGALPRTETNTLAPDGASVRQGGDSDAVSALECRRRYEQLDKAFTAKFGGIWTKRKRKAGRLQAWLDTLGRLTQAQVDHGIRESIAPVNLDPPSAYKFYIHATVHERTSASGSHWPPASREAGHRAMTTIAAHLPGYIPHHLRSPDHGET